MSARQELADQIDAANKKLIRQTCDTSHWSELEKTQKELADLLWVNKEAIVSYLRAAPSTPRGTPCEHAAIISLDGKWHCQKCGRAIDVAVAQSSQHHSTEAS